MAGVALFVHCKSESGDDYYLSWPYNMPRKQLEKELRAYFKGMETLNRTVWIENVTHQEVP